MVTEFLGERYQAHIPPRAVTSHAELRVILMPAIRSGAWTTSTTWIGYKRNSRPRHKSCLRLFLRKAHKPSKVGVIYYGSTSPSMLEAFELLENEGLHLHGLRLRAFPFADAVEEFIHDQDLVFVVEQNRDAQMRTLLINELEIDPAHLIKVLHYDGTPITARFIYAAIRDRLQISDSTKKTSKKSKELV